MKFITIKFFLNETRYYKRIDDELIVVNVAEAEGLNSLEKVTLYFKAVEEYVIRTYGYRNFIITNIGNKSCYFRRNIYNPHLPEGMKPYFSNGLNPVQYKY